jgi:hypothetical protein
VRRARAPFPVLRWSTKTCGPVLASGGMTSGARNTTAPSDVQTANVDDSDGPGHAQAPCPYTDLRVAGRDDASLGWLPCPRRRTTVPNIRQVRWDSEQRLSRWPRSRVDHRDEPTQPITIPQIATEATPRIRSAIFAPGCTCRSGSKGAPWAGVRTSSCRWGGSPLRFAREYARSSRPGGR